MTSRATQKRSRFTTIAIAAGAALLATTVGPIAAAHAAEEIVTDVEFKPGWGAAVSGPGLERVAQPFTPSQSGALHDINVSFLTVNGTDFTSLSIHEISDENQVSESPIPGGESVLTFTASASDDPEATATATFPGRPQLAEHTRYAMVINPATVSGDPGTGANFPISLAMAGPHSMLQETSAGWGSAGNTAHLLFSVRLAIPLPDTVTAPQAPLVQPAQECTAETAGKTHQDTVTAPAAGGGITYSEVSVSGTTATIIATTEVGYTLTGSKLGTGWTLNSDGTATWTQELRTVTCEGLPAGETPSEETPADEMPKLSAEKTPASPATAQPQQPLANSGSLAPAWLAAAGALLIALGVGATLGRRKLRADH